MRESVFMPPFATITSGGIKMETLNIGSISLTWLDGGVTHMDGGAMFGVVPKPLWSRKYPVNDKTRLN